MRRAAQVSQYVYQYNKSFMKVIKHLPLVRLRNDSSATPFIPTKDKVAARHRQFNLPKLVISNRTDLSGFNPEELLREERKDKLAEILDFIPQHRLFNKKRTVEYSPGSLVGGVLLTTPWILIVNNRVPSGTRSTGTKTSSTSFQPKVYLIWTNTMIIKRGLRISSKYLHA
ncbi:hypothetical protein RclHR1_05300001 [Rhizophagus clarus]|uniref:Uncharacterized protein n=1 Tax=Rhizophagus clarus TaxID=94130 RepID=A0A2Z6S3T0_9GLOM|nr:hypothetical protein RclHR1_05300001 [Rhizophagus clarus]